MTSEFKKRVLLPVVLPLAVLLAAVTFILAIAATLLFNTHEGSLALAAVVAAGILFMITLAASRDRLGRARGAVVILAAALPLLVGAGIATGLVGDVADEDRMINVEPTLPFPEGAPLIAAEDSFDFCLPENAECEVVDFWEVTPSPESDLVAFTFDNREAGVPHDVQIFTLEGTVDDPAPGDFIVKSNLITGPATDDFVASDVTWDDLPEQWYFNCSIHPNMNGVGEVVEDA